MIYNNTKRLLELIASIFGIVCGITVLGISIYLFITGIMVSAIVSAVENSVNLGSLIPGILLFATSITSIVFSALLIKSPVRPEGVLNRKSKQICLIVFSILSGNLISFVLEIIVLYLPNFVDKDLYAQKSYNKYIQPNLQTAQPQNSQSSSIEGKINELKHLKELGVIDEATYNKAVDKIISEIR